MSETSTMPPPGSGINSFDSTVNQFKGQATPQGGDLMNVMVYTGRTFDKGRQSALIPEGGSDEPFAKGEFAEVGGPERITAGELASRWFQMDSVERNRYKDTFILMGIVDPRRATDEDYSRVWTGYVQQLARYNLASPETVAPDGTRTPNMITIGDLIDSDLRRREESDPGLRDLLRTGKRTTTRTSTNIQKSSNLDARALADASARALLGRKATDEESGKLLAELNRMESENPEVTTTTQESNMYGDITGQTSTTSGGVTAASREQLAREAAEANPEYGAYQAATTYMGSLMDMVYGKGY